MEQLLDLQIIEIQDSESIKMKRLNIKELLGHLENQVHLRSLWRMFMVAIERDLQGLQLILQEEQLGHQIMSEMTVLTIRLNRV